MRTVPTTCPMDCPDTCAVEVDVEPGDGGVDRVVALRGAADHPTTRGFLCSKVARFAERLDGPERLLHPLRRTGAKGTASFARISWEEALAEITGRFRHAVETWGGEAILPFHYGGSNGLLAEDFLDDLYFARLGASRLAKTICAAPATAVATAMYGKMPGVSHEDFVHARAIVLWGANPKSSHIHLVPFLKEAGRRGAFVATVDPERHFSEAEVDLHLPVLPGADLPLALAIAHRWQEQGRLDSAFLERWTRGADALLAAAAAWDLPRAAAACGVEEGAIARLADAWSDASPALLRLGWGVERNRNGGQAMAAILALPALGGKLGVKGGGYTLSNSGWARLDPSRVLGAVPWSTRVVNMNRLGAWLAPERGVPDPQDPAFPPRPPVQALFVYNANPVATVPDQRSVLAGLAREDLFTVVFEQVMTDTARWADVVLPAITFLEGWELKRSYGSYGLGGIRPAVAPRGEARSNPQVFAALGRAMGFADEAFGWDDETLLARTAAAVEAGGGPADGARLAAGGWVRPAPADLPVQLGNVFPATADGLVHLAPAELGRQPFRWLPPDAGRAPLALISPADPRRISSSLGELGRQDLAVTLHPADAAARGIASGDRVRVFNELGEVVCPARLSDRLRPGVARLPKGAWQRHSQNGETANALCPSTLGFAGGACFNDARVEVEML